jgi:hypothetical protein
MMAIIAPSLFLLVTGYGFDCTIALMAPWHHLHLGSFVNGILGPIKLWKKSTQLLSAWICHKGLACTMYSMSAFSRNLWALLQPHHLSFLQFIMVPLCLSHPVSSGCGLKVELAKH